MSPLRWTIAAMAVFMMTATFVALRSDVFGQVADFIGDFVEGDRVGVASAANVASATDRPSADFRWTGRLEPGMSLEVKGVNGAITARAASGDEAVVTAETRGRRSDPSQVSIEIVEHGDGVTLCAVYPTPEGRRENYCAPGSDGRMSTNDNDVQVEFFVEVPRGVDFVGRTVNGDVEALDLGGDVMAVSVNGDIDVSTTGFAEAETVNGSIDAIMGGTAFSGARFSTVNGSIRLDVADDLNADVSARWLNGSFESDLPFSLQGRLSRRSASGALGAGGAEIEIETVNGSIRIR